MRDKKGKVYLVGAGPGDPGLLTRRGGELLARAEVVVHDYLAAPELLNLAPAGCRFIYVGKTGRAHTLSQEEINSVLVTEAKAGSQVVRLKGGDPYIFGRGGEEATVLADHGLDFEVVPGISSTVAAAAAAGIPLTHRELSSQVVFITGHEKDREDSVHDWSALAKIGTLVAVMGSVHLSEICRKLIGAGRSQETPAAMIQWGTTSRQVTVAGTLSDLPEKVIEAGLGAPALLVVGPVVALREKLNWFERRPLWGRRIMVTRTKAQAGHLVSSLRELGADVLEAPLIKIEPIAPNPSLLESFEHLSDYQWLILTSPNGAEIFLKALFESGRDSRALSSVKIAVIGPGTAEALSPFGLKADLMPATHIAEDLAEALLSTGAGRCLLARSKGREVLIDRLRAGGFVVDEIMLYRTLLQKVDLENPDLTTLTSGSTAEGLSALVPLSMRSDFRVVSIGPITTRAAKAAGFKVVAESPEATIPSLLETIVRLESRI